MSEPPPYHLDISGRLSPLDIEVRGDWSPLPSRKWHGRATAAEPFVAVVFLREGEEWRWCKSERGGPPESAGTAREVGLSLSPYDETGEDVQLVWAVGRGDRRTRIRVASPPYRPELPDARRFRTGSAETFARVDGAGSDAERAVELLVLFLARRDVKSARNGLWRLRGEFANSVRDDAVRRMLTYGRTGVLALG